MHAAKITSIDTIAQVNMYKAGPKKHKNPIPNPVLGTNGEYLNGHGILWATFHVDDPEFTIKISM